MLFRSGHQPLARGSLSAAAGSLRSSAGTTALGPVSATLLDPISDLGMQKAKAKAAGSPRGPGQGEAQQTPLLEHSQTCSPTPSHVQGQRGPPSLSDCGSWTLPIPQAASWQPSGGRGHSIVFLCFLALITEEVFLISPCYSLELCIQMGMSSAKRPGS